jgi:hypothetical protein
MGIEVKAKFNSDERRQIQESIQKKYKGVAVSPESKLS